MGGEMSEKEVNDALKAMSEKPGLGIVGIDSSGNPVEISLDKLVPNIPDINEMLEKFGGHAGYLRAVCDYALLGKVPVGCEDWDWDTITLQHFEPAMAQALYLAQIARSLDSIAIDARTHSL